MRLIGYGKLHALSTVAMPSDSVRPMKAVCSRPGKSPLGWGQERSSCSLRFPEDLDQPRERSPSQMCRLSIDAPVIEIATPSGSAWIAQPCILTVEKQVEEAPWCDRASNAIPVTTS